MLENASYEIYYLGIQCMEAFVSIYLETNPLQREHEGSSHLFRVIPLNCSVSLNSPDSVYVNWKNKDCFPPLSSSFINAIVSMYLHSGVY